MIETIKTDTDLIYNIDEEHRSVACMVNNCADEFYNIISKSCSSIKNAEKIYNIYMLILTQFLNDDMSLRNTYVGVARCSPTDSFNLKVGMDLARSRALAKREKAYHELFNRMLFSVQRIHMVNEHLRYTRNLYTKHLENAHLIANTGLSLDELFKEGI